MKSYVVIFILISISLNLNKCNQILDITETNRGNKNSKRIDMNRKIKSIKEVEEIQKYNTKQSVNNNYFSFLEMQSTSTERLSNKLRAMNRLEHTIRVKMAMRTFRSFLTEEISTETKKLTELLVDNVYSAYVKQYSKESEKCVGWMDGTDNSQLRLQKIYESVIYKQKYK